MIELTVLRLLELDAKERDPLMLKCIGGKNGLGRTIASPTISRPGLPLSGYYKSFSETSIQVIGKGEQLYLADGEVTGKTENLRKFFTYNIPCCVFTDGAEPKSCFKGLAEEHSIPILQTELQSSDFSRRLYQMLDEQFAPTKTVHAVLVEVFGIGVLMTGESGVGKSETALELLDRGHRLISDDTVKLKNINDQFLVGSGPNPNIAHHMEIRGLGIINIPDLYGVGAIREKKQVQIWVHLEDWDKTKCYQRIDNPENDTILGIRVPKVIIPVKPGRNIPIIIETAAREIRLHKIGYNASSQYDKGIAKFLESQQLEAESK